MKRVVAVFGLGLALVGSATAQVTVQVVLEDEQYLRNESLPVRVRVSNSSGQTLRLGREPGWLTFQIRDGQGRDVPCIEKVPLADPFELAPSKIANLSIDLMPYYQLSRMGKYTLAVELKVAQLNQSFGSQPASFDIINGTKLWEREFGVPSATVPEVRKYALQQANFIKQLRLYARVTDPVENRVFRVTYLGPLLSFSKPEAQLDASSNLHVLFQNSARTFIYVTLSPDGEIVVRQTHEFAGSSRPTLRHDEEKGVRVQGGQRRLVFSDIPPPPESIPAPPPAPSSTNVAPNVPSNK